MFLAGTKESISLKTSALFPSREALTPTRRLQHQSVAGSKALEIVRVNKSCSLTAHRGMLARIFSPSTQ